MNRVEKTAAIADLKEKFEQYSFFYLADASTMSVGNVNKFRRLCFEKDIKMEVVKNTLAVKALTDAPESKNYQALFSSFHGPTAILFTTNVNAPARIIEEFRKSGGRPLLKAAYIDTAVFIGDDQLEALTKLKSRDELVGEVLGLLQSPARNVISALQSGGHTIAGLVKTLEERASAE